MNRRAALAFAVLAVVPLFLGQTSLLLHDMILAGAYVIMALGLNVVVGFAGLLDLGYVAFYAIGAHVGAWFASSFWDIHLPFVLVLVLAMIACALAGILIGVPTLRLRGDYVGLVTLAFGEIIGEVIVNGREIQPFGATLTGGPNGISGIDRIFDRLDLRPWYWLALALVALVLAISFRLRDSRPGRAWIAVRDDEAVAACAGIPIVRTKLLAYGTGAALGGLSGAFLTFYEGFVDPRQFTFSFSIFILAMVVLGGLGSIWGVVAGAIVLSLFDDYLLPRVLHGVPGLLGVDFDLAQVSSGIYGLLLVVTMLLRPHGLFRGHEHRREQAARAAGPRAVGEVGLESR